VILPFAALLMSIALAFLALSIDVGYICKTVDEAQNAADAAALSAAQELYPGPEPQTAIKLPLNLPIYRPVYPSQHINPALSSATSSGGSNRVAMVQTPLVRHEDIRFAVYDGGVTVGPPQTLELVDTLLDTLDLHTTDNAFVNSVEVTVRRDELANGRLKLFYGDSVGSGSTTIAARSQAAIFRGYGIGAGDMVLPFAMDVTVWNALRFTNGEVKAVTLAPLGIDLNALSLGSLVNSLPILSTLSDALPLNLTGAVLNITDEATWRRGMTSVQSGADGIWEVLLLADQLKLTQAPGLLGLLIKKVQHVPGLTVSLRFAPGSANAPDASQLNRMIRTGLSATDISQRSTTSDNRLWMPFHVGGHFEVPDACESALREIIGKPRILPLYATLPGTIQ